MAKEPASPAVEGIGVVPKEALRFLKNKSLKPSFRWQEVYAEEHAASFTVAAVTKADLLQEIHDSLNTAIEKGVPYQQWKKELQPTLVKHGWWGRTDVTNPETGELRSIDVNPHRLKNIYNSNLRSAYSAGQWERAQRTKLALPYLLYELGPSKEHRAEHQRWAGTILPVDDAWWDSHMPPNGWGCKCRTRQVSRTEAASKGYDPAARPSGEGETKEFVNKESGEVRQVPVGIDPGWESNPGKVRQARIETLLARKIDRAPAPLAIAATNSLVESTRFQTWAERVLSSGRAKGEVQIVGRVEEHIAEFVSAKGHRLETHMVMLDDKAIVHAERAAKALRGASLSPEELLRIPEDLRKPESVLWDNEDPALIYVVDAGDKKTKIVVRVNWRRKGEVTNRITTFGKVQPENLRGDRYETIPSR